MQARTIALILAVLALAGCGNENNPSASPVCAPEPTVAAPGGGEDFSALDPARCPAILAEDPQGAAPQTALVALDPLEAKAFYLLARLEDADDARRAIDRSPVLAALGAEKKQALDQAVRQCNGEPTCVGPLVRWSDADIERAGDALAELYSVSTAIQSVAGELRASGYAHKHAGASNTDLLRLAWHDAAEALDRGWDDYPSQLSPSTLGELLRNTAGRSHAVFFTPLFHLVVDGLLADDRDEAGRYEPLAEGENAAAVERIPCIDFSRYPFSVILVPGQGPMDLDHPLDLTGRVRADQAAARFAAGLAPLIAVSGGHVHPDRTPYSEAIEMKKYLVATHAIPESAILIDPHARHTTTNLRNVSRLIYRYGVPADQPVLVTSDQFQIAYMALAGPTQVFGKRCLDELGYLPYRGLNKLGYYDDCLIPSIASLYADARDLLDP